MAESTTSEPRRRRLTGTRGTIARRLTEAWKAPAFHLSRAVAVEPAQARVAAAGGQVRATLTDELVRCCATALRSHPALNAHLLGDEVVELADTDIGLAVAAPRGLIVPVLRDASRFSLEEIAERRAGIVERARAGTTPAADLAGATFTISNLGMMGIERFDAILNPPGVAILAVGAASDVPVRDGDAHSWSTRMDLTLTCDHRAVDGADGARFLAALVAEIEGTAP